MFDPRHAPAYAAAIDAAEVVYRANIDAYDFDAFMAARDSFLAVWPDAPNARYETDTIAQRAADAAWRRIEEVAA